MKISVLTVNYYSGRFTELLAYSLFRLNRDVDLELNIFDNGSSDGSLRFVDDFRLGKVNVIREPCPYSFGSSSHGFAVDFLLKKNVSKNTDIICLIDSDCFSFTEEWLSGYCNDIVNGTIEIIASQAFCPTVDDANKYMWPGFVLYHPSWVQYIVENGISFIPNPDIDRTNDSGQMVSLELEKQGAKVRYLPRTPPNKVGTLSLEKWSIDKRINHFFAASMASAVRNPLAYVYGDKSRGRYITKLYNAWRLFRQPEVRRLMSKAK